MTEYPPADDRLRHLLAQEINTSVDTWKLAFWIAGNIVKSPEIRREMARILSAHTLGHPCGDRNCEHCYAASLSASAGPVPATDRAALAEDLRYVLSYRDPGHAHDRPGVWNYSGKPCGHCARLAAARQNLAAYDADPNVVLPASTGRPAFVPPAAEGLPPGALDSATDGADALDAWAQDPHGRNFLAHALVQLARDGWLHTEPGAGFETAREREAAEPQDPDVLPAPDGQTAEIEESR